MLRRYNCTTNERQINKLVIVVTTATGTPSSKYEHRRASALLRNIQNIRICMGKEPIVSVTHENERISIKNSLPYLKCVTSLLCGPRVDLWPFYGFLCKRFSLCRAKTVLNGRENRFFPILWNVKRQCRCSPMLIFRAWATCVFGG